MLLSLCDVSCVHKRIVVTVAFLLLRIGLLWRGLSATVAFFRDQLWSILDIFENDTKRVIGGMVFRKAIVASFLR